MRVRNLYWQLKAYLSWKSKKIKREENKERTDTLLTARGDNTPVAGDEWVKYHGQGSNSWFTPPVGTNWLQHPSVGTWSLEIQMHERYHVRQKKKCVNWNKSFILMFWNLLCYSRTNPHSFLSFTPIRCMHNSCFCVAFKSFSFTWLLQGTAPLVWHTTCLALPTLNKQKAPVIHRATHHSHLESGGERELRGKEVNLMSKLVDYWNLPFSCLL